MVVAEYVSRCVIVYVKVHINVMGSDRGSGVKYSFDYLMAVLWLAI